MLVHRPSEGRPEGLEQSELPVRHSDASEGLHRLDLSPEPFGAGSLRKTMDRHRVVGGFDLNSDAVSSTAHGSEAGCARAGERIKHYLTDPTQYPHRLGRPTIRARLALHQDKLDVVLYDGVRFIWLPKE